MHEFKVFKYYTQKNISLLSFPPLSLRLRFGLFGSIFVSMACFRFIPANKIATFAYKISEHFNFLCIDLGRYEDKVDKAKNGANAVHW